MSKREQQLRKSGYRFSGHYFRYGEREMALETAKQYRNRGYRAQVLTVVSVGRVYNSEGYSVYVKEPAEGNNQ